MSAQNQDLESALLSAFEGAVRVIQTEKRSCVAKIDGLSMFLSPEDRERFLKDGKTCLMMQTQYPMSLDPAHVDQALLRRSAKFLAAMIMAATNPYNPYAVPHSLSMQFDENYLGFVVITWAHHIELLPEGTVENE